MSEQLTLFAVELTPEEQKDIRSLAAVLNDREGYAEDNVLGQLADQIPD